MKTTLEIADELLRRTKAAAALRGESLEDFVTEALEAHLDRERDQSSRPGWRAVFGQAQPAEVEPIDQVVGDELQRVDPDDWR